MTKHRQEDAELKLLRSTLLSSIRTTPKAVSQDVCDTDVPDLDALREAALKSLNNQANQGCDVSKFSNYLSSNAMGTKECVNDWVPKYRLRPRHRSNLVVIQAISLDANHSDVSSTTRNQGSYAHKFFRRASLEEDHWPKSERNQRSTAKDECGIQNTESEDEILTVDSIHSDLDEDADDNTTSTVVLESISDKISSTRACMDKFESMLHKGRHATLQLLTADVESDPAPVVVNDIIHANNGVQMDYIERELMHLQPGFDIELLGFDDSYTDQVVINDNNNCIADTNLESESTMESSTMLNELKVNDVQRRIVINEHRHKCRIRIRRRRSRSPSRNVIKKRRSKTPPYTSVYSRHGSSRRSSVNDPLPKLPTSMYSHSSTAVKHNDTNKPTYKPRFFALHHKYNRRARSDNFI